MRVYIDFDGEIPYNTKTKVFDKTWWLSKSKEKLSLKFFAREFTKKLQD